MNLETYTFIGVAIIILLLLYWIIRLEIKLRKLLGKKNCSLDDSIDTIRKEVIYLKKCKIKFLLHCPRIRIGVGL